MEQCILFIKQFAETFEKIQREKRQHDRFHIEHIHHIQYDEESDHSNKAVRKTPEIESGHKVAEEVK